MKRAALQRWIPFRLAALVAPLIAAWPMRSQAASGDWNVAGGGSWATYGNWTPVGPPVPGNTAGDTISFSANPTASSTVTLDGTRTVGTLNISPATGVAVTLAGNNTGGYLIFDNGPLTARLNFLSTGATPGLNAIFAPVVLRSNLEVSANIVGQQAIRGTVTGAGSLTFDSDGAHPAGTTNAIGDFLLGGVNSYTGGTTITESRVITGSNWAFGTGAVTVGNGGQVYNAGGGFFRNDITISGQGWNEPTGQLGAIRNDANTVFNGTIRAAASAAPFARIGSHANATTLFNGRVTGDAPLEFAATSTNTANFILNSNANDWSGATRVGRGTAAAGTANLQLGNLNASGVLGAGDITLDAGGNLVLARTDNHTVANNILAGQGTIVQNGLGTATLTSASILQTGGFTVNNTHGRLLLNPGGTGGALTLSATPGTISLSNWADIEFNSSSNLTLGTYNGGRGSYLVQSGSGTLTLGGNVDNNSARVLAAAGTTVLGKTAGTGIQAVGSPFTQYGLLVNNGATVRLAGAITGLTAPETNNQIFNQTAVRLNTGGTLDLNGSAEQMGFLTGGGSVTNANPGSAANLLLGGANGVAATNPGVGLFFDNPTLGGSTVLHQHDFSGVISDGTGITGVTKVLAGLQTLSGVNTYTGATAVNGGTLAITGSTAAAGAVNVGGGTLAGTGSVGNITLTTGTIAPGLSGQDRDAVGNLTASSLTQNGGDIRLNFGGGGNDTITLTGAATLTAGTVTPAFTSAPSVGTTTIITGGAPATVGTATVNIPAGSRITGGTLAAAGNDVTLTLAGANAQAASWAAPGTAGTWDVGTTGAWTTTDTFFRQLDSVTLSGSAANTTITIPAATTVLPAGIVDTSTGGGYTILGPGLIGGAGGIVKSGSSTLTVSTPNTFTGDVRITGGTLTAGNGAALGDLTGQTFVSGGATLNINAQNLGGEIINIAGTGVGGNGALVNDSLTAQTNATRYVRLTGDATVGGVGRWDVRTAGSNDGAYLDLGGFTLTKVGANQLSLVGANVTDGNIVHNGGLLGIETTSVVQGQGSITVNSGAQLMFWQSVGAQVTRPITLNNGAIALSDQNSGVNSPVTLNGSVTLQGPGNTVTWGGAFSESGASSLVKNQAGAHFLANNVSYTGTTTVNQGTLTLGGTAFGANTITTPGNATIGTVAGPFNGGTGGTLNYGNGGYTTVASAPAAITVNNGTLGFNTRVSQSIGSNIGFVFNGGNNTLNLIGAEQDTNLTFTGSVGSSSQFGNVVINAGNATFGNGSALSARIVSLGNQNQNVAGANVGTLNITGGNHRLQALYTGDVGAANNGGIINMSGGTLTFEQNGNASLQSTNNSGVAVGGVSGIRIGHWTNGGAPGSVFNLSGGTVDASKVTVSVGWDGSGFLNITGGTLKARTLVVDNGGLEAIPFINRLDLSGGGRIEIGHGGMPTDGTNTAINSGDGTWVAVESSDWTRGMSLNGSTTFDTGANRLLMTGALAGDGNLTKVGTGILQLGGTNINTGAITLSAGLLRMGAVQSLGDGTVNTSAGTLDLNGQQAATAALTTLRPSAITIGGSGAPGSLGGLINSAGGTGGISADPGGTITIASDLTVYAVGRTELGINTATGANNVISGGTNSLTKNGQGQMIWRGAASSTLGNIVVNGGQFFAEDLDNNLGATGTITANRGGQISAWQSDGTTSQNKPIVLNGGALAADVTSTWNGGLTLTADSVITRNAGNAAVLNIAGTSLDLGGYTLVRRDRGNIGVGASAVTFTNNTSSGNGSLDLRAGHTVIGANSVFDGTGSIMVRTDATLAIADSATVTKRIDLLGGAVSDAETGTRSLTVNSMGSGYLRAEAVTGTLDLGVLNVLGAPATVASTRTAGMMFGSGNGFTANATPGAAMGSITLSNPGILAGNPNFTVSSLPGATSLNDTTFAAWDGTRVTGLAPTTATIAGAGATDFVMAVAGEAVPGSTTIGNLVADGSITIAAGTLRVEGGGIILREAGTAGWSGAGAVTSGRRDGILALTLANRFSGNNGLGGADVGAFTVGNIVNAPVSGALDAFRPVALVLNGFGNSAGTANQAYTGGSYLNGGRLEPTTPNALGLGPVWVREGGSALFNGSYGVSNNMSLRGVGITEAGGTFGALRIGAAGGAAAVTGTIRLDTPVTRIMATENGIILGDVRGNGLLERAGAGTMTVRSALTYTGATQLGAPGPGAGMGTHTVFTLANGGAASGIGASSAAASNLLFHSGTLNYIGGGASTDRLFTVVPSLAGANGITIANNGFGDLAFTNTGAVVMANGATDVNLTLTANNFTNNTFTPSLADPAGARLNLAVNGPGTWTLNGASYGIGGAVALTGGADLILDTTANVTLPVFSGAPRSYLVKNNSNTLVLGGSGLLAEADNNAGALIVNAGTVVFDKRGPNGYTAGAFVGAGGTGRISALGSSGINNGDGLIINGGTVRYAPTANLDQIFDNVDVRINGGTFDLNGRTDAFDSLNGTGGTITNGMAGTISQVGIGSQTSLPSALNFRALASYGGVIEDGAGQVELIKLGAGVQELTGTNTFTGRTSIAAGLLRISSEANLGANPSSYNLSQLILGGGGLESSANVTIDDSNRGIWVERASPLRPDPGTNLTIANGIAGPGNIDAVGRGTVTLAGANLYTGSTSLYRGTLVLDYASQNNSKLSDTAALVLRGGNLVLNGGSHTEVVSATTIDGATTGSVNAGSTNISATGGFTGRLRLNAITRTMGGTVDIQSGIADTDTGNTNGILAVTNAAYATVGRNTWAVSAGTADSLITGLAAGSYAANNFGTATNHVDVSGAASIAAASTVSTLRFNSPAATTLGGAFALTLNQQGILVAPGAGAAAINVTTLQGAALGAAGTTDLIIHQHNTSNALTISSVIANNTNQTTGITKAGAGTLILTGVNTATGVTHINEGTLELQGSGQLGNNVAGNAVWVDGTFSLNRTGAYTIANNMGGGATGVILKRDNAGIATLSGGIGTYAGSVVVSQGALVTSGDALTNANPTNELAAAGTVYGTITLGDAGTGATDNVIYSDARGAAHTIRKDIVVTNTGSSGLAIIGSGTVTNATNGQGATKGAFATIHQGTVQLNRPTTFRANTDDRLTFQGAISGNVGTLTIDAPNIAAVAIGGNGGRTSFEATNTFVGNVVVDGAILQVGTGSLADPQDQIPDASNVTLNGQSTAKQAGLQLNGDGETINNFNGNANSFLHSIGNGNPTMSRLTVLGTGTFSGVFNGTNGGGMTLEKAGSGTFTLAGTADNNAGRVLVTSGTLQLAKLGTGGGVRAVGADSVIQGGTLLLGGTGGDQIFDSVALTMYGGTFDLGGTSETVGAVHSATGTGVITNSGATPSVLTFGGGSASSLTGAVIRDGLSTVSVGKVGPGALVLTGTNTYTGTTSIAGGYIQLGNGGTTGSIAATSAVSIAAGAQLVFNRSDDIVFANTISGPGGLIQNGTGRVEIPTATSNPLTGPTVVNSGELRVNGSIASSAVTLNPGAILSGSGTTGAVGSRGGIIRPGTSPGLITTGSFVADIDTSFEFEIGGLTAGTDHDQIRTTGIISLDGTLTVSLVNAFLPAAGDKFLIWNNDTALDPVGGTFLGLAEGGTFSVLDTPDPADYWLISYMESTLPGSDGNDISLTYVPEPGSAALAAVGVLPFLRRRRRVAS